MQRFFLCVLKGLRLLFGVKVHSFLGMACILCYRGGYERCFFFSACCRIFGDMFFVVEKEEAATGEVRNR